MKIIEKPCVSGPSEFLAREVTRLTIITGEAGTHPELKAAGLLQRRIQKRSSAVIENVKEGTLEASRAVKRAELVFLVGCPERHNLLKSTMVKLGMKLPSLPNTERTHPEGFAVKSGFLEGKPHVAIAGVDERGTVYGVGSVLRAITCNKSSVDVPNIHIVDKPAFRLRGGEASASGPRSGAIELGRMRQQTEEERHEGLEDQILLGANIFQGEEEFVRSYGLMTYGGNVANALPKGFPGEWAATPSNSLHVKVASYFQKSYVCPSIPQAREALLSHFEETFRKGHGHDYFSTSSGDVGGCTCEKCMPWGLTFIKLVHDMADILHRYHPNCKVLATMQNLTNEGDQAVLDYLKERDSGWFHAVRYAPGGNEMSTYNRGDVNPRWFEYEGLGKTGNYLKHIHHDLPGKNTVVLFSDITHWIRSQYGVDRPDVALAVIYNRRSWNARPRHYHRVARETFQYAEGDMHYSEGMHDDFNKWLWYRMLWNPRLSAEEITREYCRYWFGSEAMDDIARAIFVMEETLEKPVIGNPGIGRAVELLRSAKGKIPSNLMEKDFRWRIIMQKAFLDRYIQLWLERGEELKERASSHLQNASASENPEQELEKALKILQEPQQTQDMRAIKEEVRELGEESNSIIGYREPAYFNADDFDVTEIGWWIRTLKRAMTEGDGRMRNAARMILHYEDPGEGGYHERVGWPYEPQHLVVDHTILGYFPFAGPARVSHYSMGYSWGRRDASLTFVYDGLDADARYVVRISAGFHCDDLKDLIRDGVVQSLEVNDQVIGKVSLPLGDSRLYEFDLPGEVTESGMIKVVLRSQPGDFLLVGLNEIWLMRKDEMPWSVSLKDG